MSTLVWFRQDLRLADNPALAHAAARGKITPIFILDDASPPPARALGGASRWWLHHSLAALEKSLGGLVIARGDPKKIIPEAMAAAGADALVWNRCYEPAAIARDSAIKADLQAAGVEVHSFNASLLHEPWEIATQTGGPFKVFTPYWRACRARGAAAPIPAPKFELATPKKFSVALDDLALLPKKPNWAAGWEKLWTPGEAGAKARFAAFVEDGLTGYGARRDRPDLNHFSKLAPHLHWGEISPRQIHRAIDMACDENRAPRGDADKFLSEIGWREFAHHLLFHFPTLPEKNWKPAFDAYPWANDAGQLAAWQKGQTGYPLVDAGMRELWRTGFLHNRVRMVVASFLVKHLRIDWRRGEDWFWDTLLDADLANNAAGWQWVAGSGADAAPYFRVFNPTSQAQKFDPDGVYIRRWVPELAKLPTAFLHAPWEAPASVLAQAGVRPGETYPRPIVDHAAARAAALAGYGAVKGA